MYIPPRFTVEDDNPDLQRRFTAYIELVVSHARIDYLRRHNRYTHEVSLEGLDPDELPVYEDLFSEIANEFDFEEDKLSKTFYRLNLLRQRILKLIFFEGLSAQETANRLNCSVNYVYQHKHRAIEALKIQLLKGGIKNGE